ncbi:hypothetical protein [Hydrogenophaga defluvii]|uniref:NERD domain-containing protein n=1 Tax=Hydrogenophaga defluvii TaxID=249410 RepID=A0ABW2SB92_9BURK
MNWSEHAIARAISLQTLARKCVVLVDNCNWTGHECDVLAVTNDLRIIDVEVKISRADLKADAKKGKWWHEFVSGSETVQTKWGGSYQRTRYDKKPVVHPRKVWKHYYALPQEIWKPELLDCLPSKASGVLLLREQRNSHTPLAVHVERRAKPAIDAFRLKPEQVMDIARLANLRMWEAYRREEAARLQRTTREAA